MHGLKSGSCSFWHRTDLPPGSNMLRLAYADSGSACKLAGVQIIPLLTLANQILARTFFRSFRCPSERIKFSFERCSDQSAAHGSESNSRSNVVQIRRASACVLSRWKVFSGEFRRRPTALAIKFQKPDRVGRRGLSEPREDFSRLLTDAFPWLDSVADSIIRFRGKFNPTLVADSVDSRLLARLLEPLHFHFHLQQSAAQFLQLDHR